VRPGNSLFFTAALLGGVFSSPARLSPLPDPPEKGGTVSRTFELRAFSPDPKADGVTDFRGKTERFDTKERLAFLRAYGEYARRFFGDPGLDRVVAPPEGVKEALSRLKALPLPSVRKRILLRDWRFLGWRPGLGKDRKKALERWTAPEGVEVRKGVLRFEEEASLELVLPSLAWRFALEGKFRVPAGGRGFRLTLSGREGPVVTLSAAQGGLRLEAGGKNAAGGMCAPGSGHSFRLEVDLQEGGASLYLDGRKTVDFLPLPGDSPGPVGRLRLEGSPGLELEGFTGVAYRKTGNPDRPIRVEPFLHEDFRVPPPVEGWEKPGYDDSAWKRGRLPLVHGGVLEAGEDLLLRKKVDLPSFGKAFLVIESLDPGGVIWVNGRPALVVRDRRPVRLDVTSFLRRGANTIAVRVRHRELQGLMHHAPGDPYVGWHMGRAWLDLTAEVRVESLVPRTLSTGDPARTRVFLEIRNDGWSRFRGRVEVSWSPWFPEEEERAASAEKPVFLYSRSSKRVILDVPVPSPLLWSPRRPALYRVRALLKDARGRVLDDLPVVTGIRTVGQEGGVLRINGKPWLARGAQIMGFRVPLETMARDQRCPPAEALMTELLQLKEMGADLLRVHVHALEDRPDGINDPRLAEMCDQLGILLVWQTPAWIRAGEAFHVDFDAWPDYARQVIHHPSIVIWEAANHPNRFRRHPISESFDYVTRVWETIYPVDPTRLISPTSFDLLLHIGNDAGTKDWKGRPIQAPPAWTAPMMTRGSQDSITGYGRPWSVLRKWPPPSVKDFLESRERAWFNFEHEESIGQPNWRLCRGKPWYLLQSYEWDYDKGSIGRRLTTGEWLESQAWQAFSAWESMKKQIRFGVDGFSWCCLHGGPNCGTYKKPLVDALGHAKLAFYANRMAFQDTFAASADVDVVYGPKDSIRPFVFHLGPPALVDVRVEVKTLEGKVLAARTFRAVRLPGGRSVTDLPPFRPSGIPPGIKAIEYRVARRARPR